MFIGVKVGFYSTICFIKSESCFQGGLISLAADLLPFENVQQRNCYYFLWGGELLLFFMGEWNRFVHFPISAGEFDYFNLSNLVQWNCHVYYSLKMIILIDYRYLVLYVSLRVKHIKTTLLKHYKQCNTLNAVKGNKIWLKWN